MANKDNIIHQSACQDFCIHVFIQGYKYGEAMAVSSVSYDYSSRSCLELSSKGAWWYLNQFLPYG